MEISMMVAQMKTEAEAMKKELDEKTMRERSLQLQLGAISTEIRVLTEKYNAVRDALDRLGKVCVDDVPVGGVHAIKIEKKVKGHSTKPRRVGKFDPQGNKIGEFRSVCQAAKEFGWGNMPMTKYIENESKEKQIRLRGFYLEFIAA